MRYGRVNKGGAAAAQQGQSSGERQAVHNYMSKEMENSMITEECMTKDIVTVKVDMDIHDFAVLLVEKNISGAPVVDARGTCIGIALEEGLIFQDKKVHLPTFLSCLNGFIMLGHKKLKDEMQHIAATTISGIMQKQYVSVSSSASVADVATLMTEKNIRYIPVIDSGVLKGVITQRDIVRAIAQSKEW